MPASSEAAFTRWCRFLAPTEGVLSLDPTDPGNWTSGKPGVGDLVGTKYGIAAASHPDLDIPELTLDQADAIRRTGYWDQVSGDRLPPPVAFLVADAAYGSGPVIAAEQLQAQLGVAQDHDIGRLTLAALAAAIAQPPTYTLDTGLDVVLSEYAARRLLFESGLAIWSIDKGGWVRRIMHALLIARSLA